MLLWNFYVINHTDEEEGILLLCLVEKIKGYKMSNFKQLMFTALLAFSMMSLTTGCTSSTQTEAGAKCGASSAPCGSGKCGATGKCGGADKCGASGKCGSPSGGVKSH